MAGSNQPRGGIIEGINVTPLVDIVLVLLIIFIVTAKMVVAPSVPLDLPQATHGEDVQTIFSVAIPKTGELIIDGVPATDASCADFMHRAAGTTSSCTSSGPTMPTSASSSCGSTAGCGKAGVRRSSSRRRRTT